MGMVPKRIDASKQVAKPADTPAQQLNTNADMFGAAQARGLLQAGANMQEAGDKFISVRNAVRKREDVILRARAERKFHEEAFNSFTKFQTERDSLDPSSIKTFRSDLQSKLEETLSGWTGTEDGKARLQASLEGIFSQNSGAAQQHVDGVQRAEILNQLGDRMKGITAKVIEDPNYLGQAFIDADAILDDLAPGLSDEEELAQADAIRSQIVLSSINSLTDAGAYDEAAELIREHPAFIQQLSPELQRRTMSSITEGQRRRKIEVEKVQNSIAAKEHVLGRKLTNSERTELVMNRNPNAMLTEEGKRVQDRSRISKTYGEDSSEVQEFDRLTELHRAKKGTPLEQAAAARDRAVEAFGEESEEARIAQAQIDSLDPNYKRRQEKIAKLPAARSSLKSVASQTQLIQKKALEALSIVYDTQFNSVEEAISAVNSSMETDEGGFWDAIQAKLPFDTRSRELANALETLRATTIVNALTEMRQNSPTGGALGSVSERENAMLAALQGTMDIATIGQTAETLMQILSNSTRVLEDRTAAFNQDFGELLEDGQGNGPAAQQPVQGSTQHGEPIYDVTLDGRSAGGKTQSQAVDAVGGADTEASGASNESSIMTRDNPMISGTEIEEMNLLQLGAFSELDDITDEELRLVDIRLKHLGY